MNTKLKNLKTFKITYILNDITNILLKDSQFQGIIKLKVANFHYTSIKMSLSKSLMQHTHPAKVTNKSDKIIAAICS